MAKQQQQAEAKSDKKSRAKVKPIVIEELTGDLAALAALVGGPMPAAGDGTIQAQATRLGDPRLQSTQRQALAAQIGRVQGNRYLQRVIGSSKGGTKPRVGSMVGSSTIQLSALSSELEEIWLTQGREAFFRRLCDVRESDTDLNDFVERTLQGRELRRARRILGTDRPLSDTQRGALLTHLVSRLGSAENLFTQACQQVHERLQAEAQARIELAKLLVSVAAAFVVPGLGGAIGSLVNRVPASASTGIHAIALGLQSQAGNIASAIGEVGKSAAGTAITNALSARPRDFLNALVQGFAVTKDQIVTHVTGNITNRATLPDEDLWVYVSNWDPLARTISQYALEIRDRYDRYVAQVVPIGPMQRGRRSTLEQDRPYAVQIGIVWVRHSSGPVLVQAVVHNGQLRFSRFIDADMKDLAIERARRTQPRGIQTISWGPPHIFNMPSSVPRTAARR